MARISYRFYRRRNLWLPAALEVEKSGCYCHAENSVRVRCHKETAAPTWQGQIRVSAFISGTHPQETADAEVRELQANVDVIPQPAGGRPLRNRGSISPEP